MKKVITIIAFALTLGGGIKLILDGTELIGVGATAKSLAG
jgi:hypothetical protein